jgi:cytochrome c biogenesis protein CcdA/thiol-disulfide isomerase/thioredoxin
VIVLAFAFVAGLLTILAPCTLPVIPLVLGGAAGDGRRRIAGIFIGFGAAFLTVTVVFAATLATLGVTTDRLRLGAAAVLGLVGLSLAWPRVARTFDRFLAPIQQRAIDGRLASPQANGAGLVGGLAIGAGIGLIWAPCVGPIMAAVIAAAVVSGPSPLAVAIAATYVAGAAIPLAAIARWSRRATRAVDPRRADRLRRAFGVAMTVTSIVVLTGLDVPLQARLTASLPAELSSALFAIEQQPAVQEDLTVLRPSGAAQTDSVPLEDLGPAPELTGITDWINTEPLTLASLRGRVVLVHFWTFGCINCIHVQPYVKAWYDCYAADGFVVLGVHTPELSFERDIANVRDAVAKPTSASRSRSTRRMRPGMRTATATGRRSTSSTRPAGSATSTSARATTTAPRPSSANCLRSPRPGRPEPGQPERLPPRTASRQPAVRRHGAPAGCSESSPRRAPLPGEGQGHVDQCPSSGRLPLTRAASTAMQPATPLQTMLTTDRRRARRRSVSRVFMRPEA